MSKILQKLKEELNKEVLGIFNFWEKYAIDQQFGGFIGLLDSKNIPDESSVKSLVLHTRILWTFSRGYNQLKNKKYQVLAERAFNYLYQYFIDGEFGGLYWMLNHKGKPVDTKKQVYGQSFGIYALSEYYMATKEERSKEMAIKIYQLILEHSAEPHHGGYLEAFSREWRKMEDVRLSEKDMNEEKTMNTHLHILEAFTGLYRIHQDNTLKKRIEDLLDIFFDKIIDQNSGHLHSFFDNEWNSKSKLISYGHDIESGWLLQEAAEEIMEEKYIRKCKEIAVRMAEVTKAGIDESDGALIYEKNENEEIAEKHWWVQAEAMVGFFNAYQIIGDQSYLKIVDNLWSFIKERLIAKNGEWYWGVDKNGDLLMSGEKVNSWKGPYHSVRACLELLKKMAREES